ncbi:hypothetical protein CJ030_MR3G015857 [Morella rubra]|uniref:PGG domain-containing protein n=1 Tax=Morella rubra TaxID=262757 RepID=A0A6A1W5R6_9ROSI|nr:hypothetical protein CJ030_MR3G015857 [Morella rubra]
MALEVLRNDNYVSWSACLRDYLLAHNLWDIVETTREPPKPEDDVVEFEAWREKNNAALDAILSSCGTDILSQIKGISSAKNAWYSLAELCGQPSQQIHTVVDQLGSSSNISVSKQVRPALTGNTQRLGRADGKNQDYLKYASFLKAVRNGDLDAMKAFLVLHPEASSAKLTFGDQTALHIAVLAGHVHIVEELVERIMSNETLEMQDVEGYTALARATSNGDFRMIQCMIDKNPKLVSIPEKSCGSIPVVISMCFDYKELSRYLYLRTPLMDLEPEKGHHGASLISFAIYTLTLDIAVDLIRRRPNLAFAIDREQRSPLYVLASTPDAFPSGKKFVFWQRWIYSWIHIRPSRATDEIRVNIQNLQEKLPEHQRPLRFNTSQVQLCKCKENFSGLRNWRDFLLPCFQKALNSDSLTPRQVFTRNHEELMKKGEEWMKNTASSCTVVGALIVTIMFAAAFTVPGGNDQNTGLPMFLTKRNLNSTLCRGDFLKSLPKKMIIGLFALFFSIATMMVAFSATLLLMLRGKSSIILPIICLASLPVTLFVLMQFPLLVDMTMSTYGPGIFKKKMERWV